MLKVERARRQRAMIEFRNWMEANGVSRREAAAQLDITTGHLSTLINANRTASEAQVDKAREIMGLEGFETLRVLPGAREDLRRKEPKAKKPKPKPSKSSKLRPMTKFEAEFVGDVAKTWIKNNKSASQDELVAIIRALSIGIRS